jgi:16S rRNA (guanine527-N7)-methyltransferase
MIRKFFPGISAEQEQKFRRLISLYKDWNSKINVISRKDIDNIEIHHILFSLAIAKVFNFVAGTKIMDAGTGGGLPGIPLAILFPRAEFTLVDSIGKKIHVVENISQELELSNITTKNCRIENVQSKFHFVVGRAVMSLPGFVKALRPRILKEEINTFPNGIIYLKGGDVADEMKEIGGEHKLYYLSELFDDPFFETKEIVHMYGFSNP